MNGWEKMFAQWQKEYYSEPFYLACQILVIVLGITYQLKSKVGQFFILFALVDFTVLNLLFYLDYFSAMNKVTYYKTVGILNSFCFLSEFLAYYYFFLQTLQSKKAKSVLRILRIGFIALTLFYLLNAFIFNIRTTTVMYYLGAIEYLFLLIPCLVYFYELFTIPSLQNLLQRPSFWIASGIFFISFISIPYYTIASYLFYSELQYTSPLNAALFILPLGITFLFLSKAFTLKTELTT
jgi:hypothetical protein